MLNLIRKLLAPKAPDGPLNDFERLFARAMAEPAARPAFYTAFLEAEVLVSGRMGQPGQADLQFYDVDGEKVLPVFSHAQRLHAVLGPDAPVLKFSGRDLIAQVAPGKAFALNPYSDWGREFSAAELKEISQA